MSKLLWVSISILAGFSLFHNLLSHSQNREQSIRYQLKTQSQGQLQRFFLSYVEGTISSPCTGQYYEFKNSENQGTLLNSLKNLAYLLDKKLTSMISIIPGVAAQGDVYMIAYFDKACPDGWEPDQSSHGVFISGTTIEGDINDSGGATVVALQASQMPVHTHKILAPKSSPEAYKNIEDAKFIVEQANYNTNFPDNVVTRDHQYQLVGSDDLPTIGEVSFAGGGQAHNNMPPYIKKMACKIKSTDLITKSNIQAVEAKLQTALDDQKAEFNDKLTALDQKLAAAMSDTDTKMRELQTSLNNKLQEHKDEMNKKFEDYKKEMLPFHILACVSFGCFIISIIFWLVILKKVKTPQYNSKVLYSPRTTRP